MLKHQLIICMGDDVIKCFNARSEETWIYYQTLVR